MSTISKRQDPAWGVGERERKGETKKTLLLGGDVGRVKRKIAKGLSRNNIFIQAKKITSLRCGVHPLNEKERCHY